LVAKGGMGNSSGIKTESKQKEFVAPKSPDAPEP
jgi:hypothetical protein